MQQEGLDIAKQNEAGFFAMLREAVRGSEQDFTQGPLGRAIFLLAVPMVLEMLMESLFVICDVYFVSRLKDQDAVAALGLTESLLTIVYTVAIGISIGAMAIISRRIGEGNTEGASQAAMQVVWLGLAVSLVLGALGVIFAPDLLRLMGASDGVLRVGSNYTRVLLGGEVSVVMISLANAIFRGAGDAAMAMRVLILANALNITLAPLFIFGVGPFPELGVTGAAVAITVGRGAGALFALSRLIWGQGRVRVQRRHVRFEPTLMLKVMRLSGAAILQNFVMMASWIVLVRILSDFGSAALAGYTIGLRVILFVLLPSWGFSNAAATMVGQSLGAENPARAEQAVWRAAFYNACFLGAMSLLYVFGANAIISRFTDAPDVFTHGVNSLVIVSYGFVFYAFGMVLTQSFNGAGDTWTPTYINLFVFWLFELPLSYLLAHNFGFGPNGVFGAITVSFSVLAVVSGFIFRLGRWKTQKV
jgi:putative MATE family efflux protein